MKKRKMNHIKFLAAAFMMVVIMIACVAIPGSLFVSGTFNDHSGKITVTDTERVYDSNSSKYLVFGKNENGQPVVYENTDNILRGKWDSSNLQAALEIGNTYEVQLVGYRIPFLSMYENILSAKQIAEE